MSVIEVKGLRKEYRSLRRGSTVALDGLDLTVEAGGVYGFLGPNGSGKTTTIRCLLGLARPNEGTCSIFGAPSQGGLAQVIDRVGSIVEAPALFPGFTGRRNLQVLGRIESIPQGRIEDALELVGLADRAGDRVKDYSLGMKQRLAIAAALLKDPDLLILDEPANGLDPSGIREVRQLLRRLGSEGRTVLLSSHILNEVQQTCDRVAILSRGRCVAEGPVAEVLSRGHVRGMTVRIDKPNVAIGALAAVGIGSELVDGLVTVDVDPSEGARVSQALAEAGLYPSELRAVEVDLETVFLQLTETKQEEQA